MKVYIAADFVRAAEANGVADDIESRTSTQVVSRWHRQPQREEIAASSRMGGPPKEEARSAARRNLGDIDACDVFIVLTTGAPARGGRHFETGYAFAHAKPIIVVGPVEHAFQQLARHVLTDSSYIADELLSAIVSSE